jgi:queuine tRNA-ribosyltransferase
MFTLECTDGLARAGILHTEHGDVPTPAFMPVATQGSVKTLDSTDVSNLGASIVLSNTYHMYLRPGVEIVEELGGLHGFMGWDAPILTDSGGFQGFSLEHLRDVTDDGLIFKSHFDGTLHDFSPENVIEYQERLGADIIMALDICPPAGSTGIQLDKAVELTGKWAVRSLKAHSRRDQALFGIVQGGLSKAHREKSVEFITSLNFPGYAIGGVSVGESKSNTYDVVGFTAPMLPERSPRYLMGVGSPEDLVESVALGIDMFDCVLPTRIARNGSLLVNFGRMNVDKSKYSNFEGPIEIDCNCYTCTNHSVAYLHHLFRTKELLAYRLATIHNLSYILRLMEDIREAVCSGTFEQYRTKFHSRFIPPDEDTRRIQKSKWLISRKRMREQLK